MVFASIVFLSVFLPVVFLVHLVFRPIQVRNLWLIAASLLFYSYGEPVYVLLMLVSSVFNWGWPSPSVPLAPSHSSQPNYPMIPIANPVNLALQATPKPAAKSF